MKVKNKFSKILGVGLSLALLSSIAILPAPVLAQPGENAWAAIDLPGVVPDTDVGPMAIAPDGTIYAGVYQEGTVDWSVWKSEDGGYYWTETELNSTDFPALDGGLVSDATIVDIAISPNYAEDETLYVALRVGNIYRLTGAGEDTPMLLMDIVDSGSMTLADIDPDPLVTTQGFLYDIDLWHDGSDNWIMVATDLDVLVLRDNPLFENWRDQEVDDNAYAVAFAPDFSTSSLIWAVIDDGAGDFEVTSTVSPGQWGQTIDPIVPDGQDGADVVASGNADIAFSDGYSSDTTLYVALSNAAGSDGNIFMILGAAVNGTTTSQALLGTDDGVGSIEVSGNVILAGAVADTTVWRSDDAGNSFAAASKGPTGGAGTNVYMEADVVWNGATFDADDGVVYVSTTGAQSAVSVSRDGGDTYNQISWVDTEIDEILDLAFSPETASQPALLITRDTINGSTDSLWRTDDATADDVQWERVATNDVLGVDSLETVTYTLDGTAVMLETEDGASVYEIWRSTDKPLAQSFGSSSWRILPATVGSINDWIATNSATVYAAGSDGFYGIRPVGPPDIELTTESLVSIALAADNTTIIVGNNSGDAFVSADAGDTWGAANDVSTVAGNDDIYVAFDADFNVAGADGENLIYFAGSDTATDVGVAEVDGDALDAATIEALEDDTNGDTATADSFSGIWVAPDNALYAIGVDAGVEQMYRLLLHEDDNVWEKAAQADIAGLWLTSGSNIVWTIDTVADKLYALEDTLAGPVQGVTVTNVDEDSADVAWDAMPGDDLADDADLNYDVQWDTANTYTDETEITLDPDIGEVLVDDTEYDVKVRVRPQPDSPFSSRWSTDVTFITLELVSLPDPFNLVPDNGMQDASTLPSFVWNVVSNAEFYEFELSTNPAFVTKEVTDEIPAPVTAYTVTDPLDYDTNYYWRVRAKSTDALSGETAYSDWGFSNFHTMVEPQPPVTIPPQPTPTITIEVPEIDLPELPEIPEITLPPVEIPDITLPEIELPEINLPPVEIPDITVPDITLPEIVIPDIEIPPLEQPEVIVELPQPTTTVVTPTIETPPTPVYVWAIVGIGAVLTIAVIVLIVRTRRIV